MSEFSDTFREMVTLKNTTLGMVADLMGMHRESLYQRLTTHPEYWTLNQLVQASEILEWDLAEMINLLTGGKLNANGRIHNQLHSTRGSQRDARPVPPRRVNQIIRWKE